MDRSGLSELKMGFWVGLGLVLAFAVWALVQLLLGKAVRGGR